VHRAAGAAAIESEKGLSLAGLSGWSRSHGSSSLHSIASLPSRSNASNNEALSLAGIAAKQLAHSIACSSIAAMSAPELTRFTAALEDATEGDMGHCSHRPLRQLLGMVLAEASNRSTNPLRSGEITRRCVRAVIHASRARLLHIEFSLDAPKCGVAKALSDLEAWKRRDAQENRRLHYLSRPQEKEATSLELCDQGEEEGVEVNSVKL